MIGFLRGVLHDKQPPMLSLDVQGVGYELQAPMSTFYKLPACGETVMLMTHLAVREDAHVLYGFATSAERSLFQHLIKVSGIGGRIALAILSGMGVAEFSRAIEQKDVAYLVSVPGIGKKTGERLVVEMQGRLTGLAVASALEGDLLSPGEAHTLNIEEEALHALQALGYRLSEAKRMVAKSGALESTEATIKQALQAVGQR